MDKAGIDRLYMQRCLDLARGGIGKTGMNPLVGAIIVSRDGFIAGEGFHLREGGDHAEVKALNEVKDADKIKGGTLYVNLEPCSHHGKTPPCTDAVSSTQLKRVVVANTDPDPKVKGKGLSLLEERGFEVEAGVMQEEGLKLNEDYFISRVWQRPKVVLKWAQSADGFIADENFNSKWLSNTLSRQLVHKWRFESDAIMVGTNTIEKDDPALTVRDWAPKKTIRVGIDEELSLSRDLKFFNRELPTILFTKKEDYIKGNLKVKQVKSWDGDFNQEVLKVLYEEGIKTLFIEGGTQLLNSFIARGLWDEVRVFHTSKLLKKGVEAPAIGGEPIGGQQIGNDLLRVFRQPENYRTLTKAAL